MITYLEYLTEFTTYRAQHREQRRGQAAFNTLAIHEPGLADEVRGTDLDPFLHNGRLSGFLIWLESTLAERAA